MLKTIWFLSLLWFFSGVLHAEELKILQFKQAINLSNTETLDFELQGLAPDTAFWTAIYLVAQQGTPDGQAHMAIKVENEGAKATTPLIKQLKAEQLPRANGSSLLDLPELSRAVQQMSQEEIDTPALPEGSALRAYVQLVDWTSADKKDDGVKLSFSFPIQEGLYAVSAYVLVGQGQKPKELIDIRANMIQVNQPKAEVAQVDSAGSETSGVVAQLQPNESADTEDAGESNRTRMLLASLAIILLGYWLWRRRR